MRESGDLQFGIALAEDAKAVEEMRRLAAQDLTARFGQGHWSGESKLAGIRERIKLGDEETLRPSTLFVLRKDRLAVASLVLSRHMPSFWKASYWKEPKAIAVGVTNLVVHPQYQRQGLGRLIMDGAEKHSRDRRIEFMRLDAYTDNPISTNFYRALGYDERIAIDLRGTKLTLFEKRLT